MNNRKLRMVSRIALCVGIGSLWSSGCKQWTQRGAKGIGLLQKAAPDEKNFSTYQPQNPYSQLASGIMTRTLYETAARNGLRIEVRDLLVGPKQRTGRVALSGSAVCEVRSGSGVLTVSGKGREFQLGATFALSDSEAFAIENKSEIPVTMRVYLFRAE
jgi:hypothetical protein